IVCHQPDPVPGVDEVRRQAVVVHAGDVARHGHEGQHDRGSQMTLNAGTTIMSKKTKAELEALTVDELKDLAHKQGTDLGGAKLKDEIITTLDKDPQTAKAVAEEAAAAPAKVAAPAGPPTNEEELL